VKKKHCCANEAQFCSCDRNRTFFVDVKRVKRFVNAHGLHGRKSGKDKQNVEIATPLKFSADAHAVNAMQYNEY